MATEKQRKLAELIVENQFLDKPLNAGQMLEKVGYSENLVKQPGRVIAAEGVQRTIAELIPDELLVVKHHELLNKTDKDGEIDTQAVAKALDMAYKLKGSYAAEKTTSLNVNVDLKKTDKTELDDMREQFEEKLRQRLTNPND